MTQREFIIESIFKNSHFENCKTIDADACDTNCKKCAERQLVKYEQKIRAEVIDEYYKNMLGALTPKTSTAQTYLTIDQYRQIVGVIAEQLRSKK